MRINFLAVLFFLCFGFSQAGIKDYLNPEKLKKSIKKEIAELDIKFKLKLLDVNVAEGVGIASGYRYEVEPSYMDGFYNRVDKWNLNMSLSPGDWVPDYDLPISLNISSGAEIIFVRQFKKKMKAMKAMPYTPARIPLTAKRALEKLQPGDFVSIPARLNIVLGAGASATDGIFSAHAGAHYLVSGEFQIHVFRMKDNHVRIKLIALRKKAKGASASVGWSFDVFGINLVDKQIKKLLGTELLRLGLTKEKGDLFLVDYVFDLRDEASAKAYNMILSSVYKFRGLKILDPFTSNRRVSEQLISDLTPAEEIFREDRDKPADQKRIDRMFKGANKFEQSSKNFRIGMALVRFEKGSTYTENHISFVDRDEKEHRFFYPTHSETRKRKFLFGLFKSERVDTTFALFPEGKEQVSEVDDDTPIWDQDPDTAVSPTPEEEENRKYRDFGMSIDIKDKRNWGWEQKDFKEYLQRNIPDFIYDEIPWGAWAEEKFRRNVRIYYQVLVHKVAVQELRRAARSGLQRHLDNFLDSIPLPKPNPSNDGDSMGGREETWVTQNSYSLRKMIKKMDEALAENSLLTDQERISKLMSLRKNGAFKEIGMGFMISLIDHRSLKENIFLSLTMSAKDEESLKFQYGDNDLKELYLQLQYVQGILNNRSFDMRLIKQQQEEEESEFQGTNFSPGRTKGLESEDQFIRVRPPEGVKPSFERLTPSVGE
jgi:hypothetical protein